MSNGSGLPVLAVEGHRATIRLNRPEVHNRIEPEDIGELMALLDRVEADRGLRVLVLTGTGKSFSSGFNIGEIGAAPGPNSTPGFEVLTDRMERCRLPTICALNGGVYGGSTDLALACDFRVGVTGMSMFMPAARLGLHYYPGGMRRYVSRLGVDTAKRLFLLGQKVDAQELLRIGFLTDLVAPAALEAAVGALADTLAANAPLAVQGMKKALNSLARGDADLAEIEAAAQANRRSADLAEGQRAWMEKRTPRFIGA
ncbi:enoyl-CoA hydratase/isomerase family protein [Limobrevibacterium gyesilva]|uniref:Enoyl-CoA hydratase/isomerase family protein n=1 Tax=Limobrevibacterium gyesilva TaxID=2991712 RepID=A0AA41YPN6_9PROT|nr:enoyl-CoA hydratase/isomerase family protein [Limobrevibacterium gyesilva]MCW3474205.1 enoyl-CoA hydratase/isomerase family protein [Limobrevibacterium gyesilva]